MTFSDEDRTEPEADAQEETLQEDDELAAAELEGDVETNEEHLDRDTGGAFSEAEEEANPDGPGFSPGAMGGLSP